MAESRDLDRLFVEGTAIDAALQRAAGAAHREYVRLGRLMPTWTDGRLVWVQPEELDQDAFEAPDHELPTSAAPARRNARSGAPPRLMRDAANRTYLERVRRRLHTRGREPEAHWEKRHVGVVIAGAC